MKGRSILYLLIGVIVVGLAGLLVTTGIRYLNENNSMQRDAKIALEDYIDNGWAFPTGEYVSLTARWVVGPYATETRASRTNGISATSGVLNYYYIILEDNTIMTLMVENAREKAVLNRMSDWLLSVDGFPMDGETIRLQGTLRELKDEELLSLYRQHLASISDIPASDPSVRYLVLDTTEGREGLYLIIGGLMALIVIILIIQNKKGRKQKQPIQRIPDVEYA